MTSIIQQARDRASSSAVVLNPAAADADLTLASDKDKGEGNAGEAPTVGINSEELLQSAIAGAIIPSYEPYVPVKGDYKALDLNQFYDSLAVRITPNADGWYHPETEEHVEMLEYYATKNNLVEAFSE